MHSFFFVFFRHKSLFFIFPVLFFALMVLYIFQVNMLTATVYRIGQYEKDIHTIKEENRALEAQRAKILSFKNLENLAAKLQFEKVGDITYIQIPERSVARTINSQ